MKYNNQKKKIPELEQKAGKQKENDTSCLIWVELVAFYPLNAFHLCIIIIYYMHLNSCWWRLAPAKETDAPGAIFGLRVKF